MISLTVGFSYLHRCNIEHYNYNRIQKKKKKIKTKIFKLNF